MTVCLWFSEASGPLVPLGAFKCERELGKELMSLEMEIMAGSMGGSDSWLLLLVFTDADVDELFNGGKSAELIADDDLAACC